MTSLLNIGASGLRTQQAALTVTGQNITNANTEGYTRQRVNSEPQLQGLNGSRFAGAGVRVTDIQRITDAFAEAQVLQDTSLFAQNDTLATQIGQIEGILFDEAGGLNGALEKFFASVNAAVINPDSLPERQLVLAQAQGLAGRFSSLGDTLGAAGDSFRASLESTVNGINGLSASIAQLNDRIANLDSGSQNGALNGLLDQRQALLADLATLTDVQVTEQAGNQVSVLVGKGQPLVLGASSQQLAVRDDDVVALNGTDQRVITKSLSGGTLGGLLEFNGQVLKPTQQGLGQLAFTLVDQVNAVQSVGIDLEGQSGRPLFADPNREPLPGLRSSRLDQLPAASGSIEVRVADAAQSPLTSYHLEFSEVDANAFSVIRQSDGQVVAKGSRDGTADQRLEFDQVALTLGGDFSAGQRYELDPLADAFNNVQVVLADAKGLAFAQPLRAEALLSNSGSGELVLGELFDANHPQLAQGKDAAPLLIRFSDDNNFDVFDYSDPANPTPLDPPIRRRFTPGQRNSAIADIAQTQQLQSRGTLTQQFSEPQVLAQPAASLGGGYPAQTFTLTSETGAFPAQTLRSGDAVSAKGLAAQLTGLTGVTARADTDITLEGLSNNLSGLPLTVYVNGVALEEVRSLDDLANKIADSELLREQNIQIRRLDDGSGAYLLRDSDGDELVLQVQGDAADRLLISRDGLAQEQLTGVGNGEPALLEGTSDVRGGIDFGFGGPYSLQLATASGAPLQDISLSGRFDDANALRNGLQSAIDATLGQDVVQVSIGSAGNLRLSSRLFGSGAQLEVQTNAATAGALGLETQSVAGVDRLASISASGRVSIEVEPDVMLEPSTSDVFAFDANFARADLGFAFELTGVPKSGDGFVVEFNKDGSSDNRNGLKMAALQTASLIGDPGSTLVEGYAQLVAQVGVEAGQAANDRDAAQGLLEQSIARRESVSGVNLDEEAANLIRFEQAYNASAQVISVARDIFNSLLNAVA